MKKIIVTGGLGFIGSALIFRLLKKTNAKIFNIDKSIQKSNLLSVNNQFSKYGISRYKLFNNDFLYRKFGKRASQGISGTQLLHIAILGHSGNQKLSFV